LAETRQFWLNLQNNWEISQQDKAAFEGIKRIAASDHPPLIMERNALPGMSERGVSFKKKIADIKCQLIVNHLPYLHSCPIKTVVKLLRGVILEYFVQLSFRTFADAEKDISSL
jgi:hypothetical protein